jgi:outer membrane protein insertion porin family
VRAFVIVAVFTISGAIATQAWADDKRPIVAFRVRGDSKLTERTLAYLAHVREGDSVGAGDIPQLEKDLLSSELFESVHVTLEQRDDGAVVVATLDDKHSWIVAPTIYFLGGQYSFGAGFAENNLRGEDKKLLLYGQIGNHDSLFYGAFLDPILLGSKWTLRLDTYLYRRVIDEYANPIDDPTNFDIARSSTTHYIGGGALLGYTFKWWLIADFRLRGAYVYFRDAHAPDGTPLAEPEKDGRDFSAQARLTLDKRYHRFGVTWGPYLYLILDKSIPGLDEYGYFQTLLRAYYSWRFFEEHQLELRTHLNFGTTLPFHEELLLGGVIDLRGYSQTQFVGDTRAMFRVEYSVPITKWKFFAFRAIGFFDGGFIGWYHQRDDPMRDYLPNQTHGTHWVRTDVGAGLRVYVKSVVLPLLGFDVARGLEGKHTEVYFEVGLTDF